MNVRIWNAIGWGVVGFGLSFCGLWVFTLMDIFSILFIATLFYLAVIGVILLVTEPKKKVKKPLNPADCPIQTLNRDDWKCAKRGE